MVYLDLVFLQEYSCICRWVIEADTVAGHKLLFPLSSSTPIHGTGDSYAYLSVNVASLNNIPNYEFYISTDMPSCSKVHCYQRFGQNYLLHFRYRINLFEETVTSNSEVRYYIFLETTKNVRVCMSAQTFCSLRIDTICFHMSSFPVLCSFNILLDFDEVYTLALNMSFNTLAWYLDGCRVKQSNLSVYQGMQSIILFNS